jgi:hypothetical protein
MYLKLLLITNANVVLQSVVIVDKELFGTTHLYDTPNFPGGVAIRIGDFNLDRYPDLLVPIQEANGTTRVQLWESVPCTVSNVTCTQEATDAGRRTFRPSTVGTDEVRSNYLSIFLTFKAPVF